MDLRSGVFENMGVLITEDFVMRPIGPVLPVLPEANRPPVISQEVSLGGLRCATKGGAFDENSLA